MQTSQPVESNHGFQTITKSQADTVSDCFALIWTRGVNQDQESSILQGVEALEGVVSACFSRKDPYILLASYDPGITNSRNILKTLNNANIQAKIVGC